MVGELGRAGVRTRGRRRSSARPRVVPGCRRRRRRRTRGTWSGCSRRAGWLAVEGGLPIADVAGDLGMHPETLRKGICQHEADTGKRSDLPMTQEREDIRRLSQESFERRRANEILGSLHQDPACLTARPKYLSWALAAVRFKGTNGQTNR